MTTQRLYRRVHRARDRDPPTAHAVVERRPLPRRRLDVAPACSTRRRGGRRCRSMRGPAGADEQRQPRLDRLGIGGGVGDRVHLAVERRAILRRQGADDLDRLLEALHPPAGRLELDAVRKVLVDLPTGTEAEHHPPVATCGRSSSPGWRARRGGGSTSAPRASRCGHVRWRRRSPATSPSTRACRPAGSPPCRCSACSGRRTRRRTSRRRRPIARCRAPRRRECPMLGQTENFIDCDRNLRVVTDDDDRDPSRDLWEQYAEWWIDNFTGGADAEYEEQILPFAAHEMAGYETVLDMGCGDGQISRLLAANGARVVGIDPTWNQIVVAVERGGGPAYARATADGLPFADASFDAVLACLVFEHIDAVDEAIAEIARVVTARWSLQLLRQPPAAADAGQRVHRRPHDRPARAVLAGRRRISSRGSRSSRSSRACSSASSIARCRGTSTRCSTTDSSCSGWSSRRRRPASSSGRPSIRARPRSHASCISGCGAGSPVELVVAWSRSW